jgi:hypothetical protein
MRSDEGLSRLGTVSEFTARAQTDQLGQTFARDRLAAECVRGTAAPL